MRTGQDSTPADTEGGAKSVAPPNRFLLPILVTLIIVGVFVGGIFLMMSKLRERLRAKVLEQDSIVLQAATAAQDEISPESQDDQMANALTAAGANDQVIGVRLYDTNGRLLNAIPKNLLVTQLSPDALEAALLGHAYSRFEPSV